MVRLAIQPPDHPCGPLLRSFQYPHILLHVEHQTGVQYSSSNLTSAVPMLIVPHLRECSHMGGYQIPISPPR